MKHSPTIILLCIFFLTSCSHRIVRTGYSKSNTTTYGNCDIAIKKNFQVPEGFYQVGKIKLGESGFSTQCSEEHAIEILRKEGCSREADLVNITNEVRANVMSSCYRCSATFYKMDESKPERTLDSDKRYKNENVQQRVKRDRRNNVGWVIAGVATGFLFAVIQGRR